MTASNFDISAGGVSVSAAGISIVDASAEMVVEVREVAEAEIAVAMRVVASVTCSSSSKSELNSLEVGSVATTRRPGSEGVEGMMFGKGCWSE